MTWTRTLTAGYLVCVTAIATAQTPERIWLQPMPPTRAESDWYPRAITIVEGAVVDFDHQQLRVIAAGDEAETIVSARRVIWIEPGAVSSEQADAIEQYESGNYANALSALPAILKQRPPVWRQQWLTMMAANAAWKTSRADIALELVSQLDRRPLPPLVIAWLPVAWKNGGQSAVVVQAAKARLQDPSLAVQLVAASWLLSSADRSEATSVLQSLATQTDRTDIARQAKCLAWRTATPPQVAASSQRWQQELMKLPMVWQVGPTVTLVDKFQSAGQDESAKRLKWSLELTPIHPHPALQD
ncbi:hypothetical protein [Rubripirellula reticaptiva]|nr:hypothetical protein [Rubripirellula reticaptiva]